MWTGRQPSGIALLCCENGSKPRIVKAGRSYEEFCSADALNWHEMPGGSLPSFPSIIDTCDGMGSKVDIVALDIPLSPSPITARREADNAGL